MMMIRSATGLRARSATAVNLFVHSSSKKNSSVALNSQHFLLRGNYGRCFSTTTPGSRGTAVEPAPPTSSKKCPFTGATATREHSTATLSESTEAIPTLKDVPAIPIFGAFVQAFPVIGNWLNTNVYKNPEIGAGNAYEYHYEMYQRFGSFYTTYIPGLGKGLYPQVYIVMDPEEMKKVIRQEGAYPRGGVEGLLSMMKWMKKNHFKISGDPHSTKLEDNGFFGRGETWKSFRTFMQTDLMHPKSAAGYIPAIATAAKIASQGMPHHTNNLNQFFNYAAFDMFQSLMFGRIAQLSNPSTPQDPVDEKFCQLAVDSLAMMVHLTNDKQEALLGIVGIETQAQKDFEGFMDGLRDVVMDTLTTFRERWEKDELNDFEKNSYFARALERQKQDGENNGIGTQELMEIGLSLLNASVDTTATFICWAMVHLSVNPEVQEKLHQEVKQNVESNDGVFASDMFSKAKAPYLNAFLRESHRVTPVHPTTMFKSNSGGDLELHGVPVAKDSIIGFDTYSLGMDPAIVNQPHEFRPERWIDGTPESAQLKETPQGESMDSVFFRDPFSQGARKCPGSRIAVNETQLLLSQIVLDWKISPADPTKIQTYQDVPYQMQTLLTPQLPEMKVEARN